MGLAQSVIRPAFQTNCFRSGDAIVAAVLRGHPSQGGGGFHFWFARTRCFWIGIQSRGCALCRIMSSATTVEGGAVVGSRRKEESIVVSAKGQWRLEGHSGLHFLGADFHSKRGARRGKTQQPWSGFPSVVGTRLFFLDKCPLWGGGTGNCRWDRRWQAGGCWRWGARGGRPRRERPIFLTPKAATTEKRIVRALAALTRGNTNPFLHNVFTGRCQATVEVSKPLAARKGRADYR